MGRSFRFLTLSLTALALSLAGCASGPSFDFDPTGVFDFIDTKKKLPGERKPVFPEGVPGMQQGIPPELMKGNQAAEAEAIAEPPPQVTPAKKRAAKRKPRAATANPVDAESARTPAETRGRARPAAVAQPDTPFPAPLPSGSFSR